MLVLGIGNILMKDDGIGVYLSRDLAEKNISAIEVREIGSENWRIVSEMENFQKVILVDASRLGFSPGTTYFLKDFDIINTYPVSLHQDNFMADIFLYKQKYGIPEEIYLFGIEPYEVNWGLGLSPFMEKKFTSISGKLRKFLRNTKRTRGEI